MIRPDVTITLACAPGDRRGYTGGSLYATASVTIEARCFAGDTPLDPTDPRAAAAVKEACAGLERAVARWLAVPVRARTARALGRDEFLALTPEQQAERRARGGDEMGNPCPLCGSMDRAAPATCSSAFHLAPETR